MMCRLYQEQSLSRALLQLRFGWAVQSRDGDCSVFLAGAAHLVLQHFGEREDGRLFEEDLHVHEVRVLILTIKK